MNRRVIIWLAAIISFSGGQACAQQSPAPAQQSTTDKQNPAGTGKHKLGPVEVSVNWRTRAEDWNWFEGNQGSSRYALGDSLLQITVGQTGDRFDWRLEAAQATLLGLPSNAVVPAPQGQLGLGGTYFAANGDQRNNASAFVKQAFVQFKDRGRNFRIGRFEFFDGLEIQPKDTTLATLVQTRVSQRLIANFGFSAVQRSFDGVQFSWNFGQRNLTLFAARPTAGVFQVDGMCELDIDVYYGAFTLPVESKHGEAELRVFSLGYIDHRTVVAKTDNRPQAARAADHGEIKIGTYGADYLQVFNTMASGKFDFLAWGAIQNGSWGLLTQRSASFVGEFGWQPQVRALQPWFSAGYSYGSGDDNPNDSRNTTFFQVLTTPRLYARFPFYNMMNNEDFYATLNLHPSGRLLLRSELHALRLASAADLWYLGGGAFQRQTFGYTGRPSSGNRGLANVWDLSADYQLRALGAPLFITHTHGARV